MSQEIERLWREIANIKRCKQKCIGILPGTTCDSNLFLNQCGDWVETSGGGGNSWKLDGNAGTDSDIDFLGTTDNEALSFRINNVITAELDTDKSFNTFVSATKGFSTYAPYVGDPTKIGLQYYDYEVDFSRVTTFTLYDLGLSSVIGDVAGQETSNLNITKDNFRAVMDIGGTNTLSLSIARSVPEAELVCFDTASGTPISHFTIEPNRAYFVADNNGGTARQAVDLTPTNGFEYSFENVVYTTLTSTLATVNQTLVLPNVGTYANDAAAAIGGVPVNGVYRETGTGYLKARVV